MKKYVERSHLHVKAIVVDKDELQKSIERRESPGEDDAEDVDRVGDEGEKDNGGEEDDPHKAGAALRSQVARGLCQIAAVCHSPFVASFFSVCRGCAGRPVHWRDASKYTKRAAPQHQLPASAPGSPALHHSPGSHLASASRV